MYSSNNEYTRQNSLPHEKKSENRPSKRRVRLQTRDERATYRSLQDNGTNAPDTTGGL